VQRFETELAIVMQISQEDIRDRRHHLGRHRRRREPSSLQQEYVTEPLLASDTTARTGNHCLWNMQRERELRPSHIVPQSASISAC